MVLRKWRCFSAIQLCLPCASFVHFIVLMLFFFLLSVCKVFFALNYVVLCWVQARSCPTVAVQSWLYTGGELLFGILMGYSLPLAFSSAILAPKLWSSCFWLLRPLYSVWSSFLENCSERQRVVGLSSVFVLYLLSTVLQSVASYILSYSIVVSGRRANSVKLLLHG